MLQLEMLTHHPNNVCSNKGVELFGKPTIWKVRVQDFLVRKVGFRLTGGLTYFTHQYPSQQCWRHPCPLLATCTGNGCLPVTQSPSTHPESPAHHLESFYVWCTTIHPCWPKMINFLKTWAYSFPLICQFFSYFSHYRTSNLLKSNKHFNKQ